VVGGRRTANALISGMLFPVVALVAGFITAAFTYSWVWALTVGSVGKWVYVGR
jgi:hypothetical protein